jgi:signal transduction histidine kinase
MISNLVVNAIEASPPGKEIRIEIETGPALAVSIVNRGTVPESIRDRFFEKFVTAGKARGTGLGTYSARLIADAHGYSLDMRTSDETDETIVTITIPGPFQRRR